MREGMGVVSEGKVKIQIVWPSNCSVNARPIWGISCSFNVFVFDGFLSVNINNYFMVGLLFKTALCKMTSVCTVFINFQFNRQIIKELFKTDLMKFWKFFDGFHICCVNFVNRRKGVKTVQGSEQAVIPACASIRNSSNNITSCPILYLNIWSDLFSISFFVSFLTSRQRERILLMWRHDLYRWGAAKLTRLMHSPYNTAKCANLTYKLD